jgi:cellobiose phosphorylase
MAGRYPSLFVGSLGRAVSFATDALSVYGKGHACHRQATGLYEGLAGIKCQHEHAMVALQEEEFLLEPGQVAQRGFFAHLLIDHPEALSAADLQRLEIALALPESICSPWSAHPDSVKNQVGKFSHTSELEVHEISEELLECFFGKEQLLQERVEGRLLSFFTPRHEHVVLRAKEALVLRPHGHIMRSGSSLVPEEASMTSTAWMAGVFHSMVTQGHVSINRFLSTCHSYIGIFRSHGQRIFVEIDDVWHLLAVPSAFSMDSRKCRWIYAFGGGLIEVTSSADEKSHCLRLQALVVMGPARKFFFSHHVALHGDDGMVCGPVPFVCFDHKEVVVRAIPASDVGRRFPDGSFVIAVDDESLWETVGGDEMLWADGQSRGEPFLCIKTHATKRIDLTITGRLLPEREACKKNAHDWIEPQWLLSVEASNRYAADIDAVKQIIPWLVNNAMIHYLSPRGLEQYSGGGWGTRDVCQGPMEFLLSTGHFAVARDLLCRVFCQQNADGDWPQWFMFFERERNIRPSDSHGDIVYWPVLALAQYLCASGDTSILEEKLPYFHPEADVATVRVSIAQHVEKALELIRSRVIAGTVLAAYGHGDWNDSLQPAKSEMRDRLCSAWTVTLNYQTLRTLADAYRRCGRSSEAEDLNIEAGKILTEFQQLLLIDGVVTGLLYFHSDGQHEAMLHPSDRTTGLSYSLLPMIHGIINDMFTPDQAAHHLGLIREHLLGPDGAHLFDRPMKYQGGISHHFQRAETASFFGREIGVMYTHAHIRYAEALARYGDASGLWLALRQINPIGLQSIVKSAALRQSNCYYSSSDAAFSDRYEAYDHYGRALRGEVSLEGGWRVYSSGSGIAVRLIVQCFLGIRMEADGLIIDPVIDPALTGMKAWIEVGGRRWHVEYLVGKRGSGPVSVSVNGETLQGERLPNPYRKGGIRISHDQWQQISTDQDVSLQIVLE